MFIGTSILGLLVLFNLQATWANADYFYRPCSKIAAGNKATVNLLSGSSSMTGMGSSDDYEMRCSSIPYLLTIADCIQTSSGLMNDSKSQKGAKKWSWNYFDYICNYYGASLKYSWTEVDNYLESHPINTTYDEANSTGVMPFKVPKSLLEPVIKPSEEYFWNRRACDVYGQALIYYIFGIMAISAFFNLLTWVKPSCEELMLNSQPMRYLRRYLLVPSTYYSRHAPRIFHCYLQRSTALQLLGLTILNYVLMGANMAVTPNEYVYSTRYGLISSALGFRSGYFAMYKLPFVFFFAARNNFLVFLTGWSHDTFNAWHRWLARITTIDVIIHFIAYNIEYLGSELALEWRKLYWIVGVVAMIAYILMCVQGQKEIRALAYEVFIVVHIALALASLVVLYFHLQYTRQCLELYWSLVALWVFDRVMRLVRIFDSGACKAICAETSPGILEIQIKQKSKFAEDFYGCFVFIYFRDRLFFWQSHPFSVVDYNWTNMTMKLLCRPQRGLSSKVFKKTRNSESNGKKLEMSVAVEGPYGRNLNLNRFENVICFAGGIGITAIYGYLRGLNFNPASMRSVQVHWAVRGSTEFFHDGIKRWEEMGVDLHIYERGLCSETAILSRDENLDPSYKDVEKQMIAEAPAKPNFREILLTHTMAYQGSVAVLCCGPPEMNLDMRQASADCITKTPCYIQYFDEFYSW